jgi:hypothetical protein
VNGGLWPAAGIKKYRTKWPQRTINRHLTQPKICQSEKAGQSPVFYCDGDYSGTASKPYDFSDQNPNQVNYFEIKPVFQLCLWGLL